MENLLQCIWESDMPISHIKVLRFDSWLWLVISAFCCGPWVAAVISSSSWVPALHVGDLCPSFGPRSRPGTEGTWEVKQ